MYICVKLLTMTQRKKNVMMSDDTHCSLMEMRMKIYKEKGLLLTMEKVIMYLIDNQSKG
jgi:hypothetical protein